MPVSEIDSSTIYKEYKQLIDRFIPSNEVPLIVCYNSSHADLYVITSYRAARIATKEKNLSSSIVVRLEDIVSIGEVKIADFLSSDYIISIYGYDPQKAIVGFIFRIKNDVYFKFAKILRDASEKAKNSQAGQNNTPNPSERLREIDYLLANKLITDAEYKQKRDEIISSL